MLLAPTSNELRHRYGTPSSEHRNHEGVLESETFTMRPGLSLTADYGPDGRTCEIQVTHTMEVEEYAQRPFATDDTMPAVVEELAPPAMRGEKYGEDTEGSVVVAEYENVLVKVVGRSGGSTGVISFKRRGCPTPSNPLNSLHVDPETARSLTPNARELRSRFGVADSSADIPDVFALRPDILLTVKYASDHRACSIEIEPLDRSFPYIAKERVTELFDELAPVAMRGRAIGGYGEFRLSCVGVGMAAHDNVFFSRWPNYCAPEHPGTEHAAIIHFTRDVCPNPYTHLSKNTENSKSQ